MKAKRNICWVKLLLTCSRFRTIWKVWLLLYKHYSRKIAYCSQITIIRWYESMRYFDANMILQLFCVYYLYSIRIRPNSWANSTVFGRIVKFTIRYSPTLVTCRLFVFVFFSVSQLSEVVHFQTNSIFSLLINIQSLTTASFSKAWFSFFMLKVPLNPNYLLLTLVTTWDRSLINK